MEESYVNAVIGNTSEFCEIFNNYEDELKNLGEKCDAISKEVEDYNNSVTTNGNASEQSYDALDDARKYHDTEGNVIAYGDLTVAQKRGLAKDALFIADREIELHDKMAEASYNMHQSARNFVKNLKSKLDEVKRSNNHLGQLNLQYVADMARNQNVIDDCLHDIALANTVDEKKSITERRIQALKENRKTELTFRINMALINATNLIQATFMQAIANMEANIDNEFENVDTYTAGVIEEEMDIMSDLTKLMASFTNIKNEYQTEKELINSINEKCKAMKKAYDDKDVRGFANQVMKSTKEFSKLIEDIQKYNEESKIKSDEPTPIEPKPGEGEPEPEPKPGEGEPEPEPKPGEGEPTPVEPEPTPVEPVRQNQDVEYKVNRRRQADSAKRNLGMAALGIGLVAANGLGLGVLAGPYLSAGILGVAALGAAKGGLTVWKRHSATHKLKKIAKDLNKVGFDIKLGEFDYEAGTVAYMIKGEDGEYTPFVSADQNPELASIINDRLSKEFKNDKRGVKNPSQTDKFEIDMQLMPKVTINNLEAAYAPIGGIRSFKDDVLGEAFSWDTNSSWLAKLKDKKFIRNIKDKSEKPVEEANIEDIVEDPVVEEVGEELSEEEVTPVVEEGPVVEGEPIVEGEPVAEEENIVEGAPAVEGDPVVEEVEPTVEGEPVVEGVNPAVETPTEEDLFADLEDPSANMNFTDEELAALLADLGSADGLEQGADELVQAVEEEQRGRTL